MLAIALMTCTNAWSVTVATFNVKLNGSPGDFGSGVHEFGAPKHSGHVTFDYTTNSDGILICTARVTGTLYFDALHDHGNVSVVVFFLDATGNGLNEKRVDLNDAPGFNANDPRNQAAVDLQFSSSRLFVVDVFVDTAHGKEVTAPAHSRVFPIVGSSTKGFPDFGKGPHVNGLPLFGGAIAFDRTNDGMVGCVDGTLYWDDPSHGGHALLTLDWESAAGDVLSSQVVDHPQAPGGNANDSLNRTPFLLCFPTDHQPPNLGARLFKVRMRVEQVRSNGSFAHVTDRTFSFQPQITGSFKLEPSNSSVAAKERLNSAFTWTVPAPLNWHDLQSLELRIRDGEESILWVHYDETSNTFSLFDEEKAQFTRSEAPGSHTRLKTSLAALHLAETSVVGSGPTGPSVTLNLSLDFKRRVAGHTFLVEVAATNDQGDRDDFVEAGSFTVTAGRGDEDDDDDDRDGDKPTQTALATPTGTDAGSRGGPSIFALETIQGPIVAGDVFVRFALPSTEPARLELLDVAGRRLAMREVGSLGAGQHAVNLSEGSRLSSGLYLVRLTQADRSQVRRAVVIH
jgi:hypothetical protein